MKKLILIIKSFFLFIVGLFRRKPPIIEEKHEQPLIERKAPIVKPPKEQSIGYRKPHNGNNRRRTRGRNLQIITVGNTTKTIYHEAK